MDSNRANNSGKGGFFFSIIGFPRSQAVGQARQRHGREPRGVIGPETERGTDAERIALSHAGGWASSAGSFLAEHPQHYLPTTYSHR